MLVPGVNVPPVLLQLPATVNVPDGAVRVPLERVTSPSTSIAPELPVSVPPDTVSPPVNVCVCVCFGSFEIGVGERTGIILASN